MCERKFSFPWGQYLRMGMLVPMVREYLTVSETTKLFSRVAVPFCILSNNRRAPGALLPGP